MTVSLLQPDIIALCVVVARARALRPHTTPTNLLMRQAYLDTLEALGDSWTRNPFIAPSTVWWLYCRETVVALAPRLQGSFAARE